MVSHDTSDLVHTLDSVSLVPSLAERLGTRLRQRRSRAPRLQTHSVGQQLQLRPEEDNESDPRAVAILKHGVIVGHLPRKTARINCLVA